MRALSAKVHKTLEEKPPGLYFPGKMTTTLLILLTFLTLQSPASVDAAFRKFWSAESPAEAEKAIKDVVRSSVSFDEALRRLKAGREYAPEKTGVVMMRHKTPDGVEHQYALNIPPNYDPKRRYQVRFQLHGGIGRSTTSQPRGPARSARLLGPPNRSTFCRIHGSVRRGGAMAKSSTSGRSSID